MSQPILEMRSITKEFPGVKALSDVSLTVHRGEVVGIAGVEGNGQSELVDAIIGRS